MAASISQIYAWVRKGELHRVPFEFSFEFDDFQFEEDITLKNIIRSIRDAGWAMDRWPNHMTRTIQCAFRYHDEAQFRQIVLRASGLEDARYSRERSPNHYGDLELRLELERQRLQTQAARPIFAPTIPADWGNLAAEFIHSAQGISATAEAAARATSGTSAISQSMQSIIADMQLRMGIDYMAAQESRVTEFISTREAAAEFTQQRMASPFPKPHPSFPTPPSPPPAKPAPFPTHVICGRRKITIASR